MGQPMAQPVGQPSMALPPGLAELNRQDEELRRQLMSIPRSIRGGTNEFGQDPRPAMTYDRSFQEIMPRATPTEQQLADFNRYRDIMTRRDEIMEKRRRLSPPQEISGLLTNIDVPVGRLADQLGIAPGEPFPTGPVTPFTPPDSFMPQPMFMEPQPTTGGLEVGMTLSPQEQALQQQLFGGAGGFFGQAQMPTAAREQAIFERMRAAQRPEEQRQRLALEERLAAQGRLGTSSAAYGGATPEMLAMATAQEEARTRSMLGAMQQAQAEQAQQAGLGQQFLGASYLPQAQLLAAAQPAQRMAELQQQAQLYGTGLFGETAMSGLESRLLAEQARANLLGGIGSNVLAGLFTPQVTKSGTVVDPGGFGDIGSIIEGIGSGLGGLFGFGKD